MLILYAALYISIFLAIYKAIRFIREERITNEVLKTFENRNKRKKLLQEEKRINIGNTEEVGVINKFNIMFERTGITKRIPSLTSEIYIIITLIIAMLIGFTSKLFCGYWAINLLASLVSIFVMYFIIYYLSGIAYERVDSQIINFINYLDNFSTSSSDIVSIIENTTVYMEGTLKDYLTEFVMESKQGQGKRAFRNLQARIENVKFQQLLKNLEIASKHDANYKEVISEARIILKGYFKNKEKRKEVVRNGRVEIVILIALSSFIFYMMQTITPNLMVDLRTTYIGSLLILFFVFLVCLSIWVFIKIDRG